mmetsp:Transcript_24436/g.78816  ORF Transcript_24436/g.78816 Transcript_24436/m.78816 type:complete len:546 (-) Transcript_24436:1275-2912(-)
MPPPSIPPPTSSYLKIKKEESAKAAAAPRPHVVSAAAAADVQGPPPRSRAAGDEVTGWPVVQPDPYPPYVMLSGRMRTILCPDAFACGKLCTRLPLYLCLGLLIGPLVLLLGIGITALLFLALTLLWYPLGVVLSWLFPRCWPGFSPPTTLVWKAARIFQTFRCASWQLPRSGEWSEANLAEKSELSTGLLHYAINIRVPLASEEELATFTGGIREVPPSNEEPAVDTGFGPTNLLFSLSPDAKIDDLETFAPDEDPVVYVMDSLTCGSALHCPRAPGGKGRLAAGVPVGGHEQAPRRKRGRAQWEAWMSGRVLRKAQVPSARQEAKQDATAARRPAYSPQHLSPACHNPLRPPAHLMTACLLCLSPPPPHPQVHLPVDSDGMAGEADRPGALLVLRLRYRRAPARGCHPQHARLVLARAACSPVRNLRGQNQHAGWALREGGLRLLWRRLLPRRRLQRRLYCSAAAGTVVRVGEVRDLLPARLAAARVILATRNRRAQARQSLDRRRRGRILEQRGRRWPGRSARVGLRQICVPQHVVRPGDLR